MLRAGGVFVGLVVLGWLIYRVVLSAPDTPERGDGELVAASIEVEGDVRDYLLYLPEGHDGERGLPLVVNLHGLSSSGANQIDRTGFNAVADEHRFAVVYPEARGGGPLGLARWDVTLDEDGADDRFIGALIDELVATRGIDASRVYATGLSYGSIMTFTLACVLGDRFAAVGGVAGGLPRELVDDCATARPVPLLHIHGDSDNIVPFDGIRELTLGAEASVDVFREAHGCDPALQAMAEPDRDPDDGTSITRRVATGCASGGGVELHVVHGGGHNWPGGTRAMRFFFGAISRDYEASEVLWAFFSAHRLPEAS